MASRPGGATAAVTAYVLSPWPRALLLRHEFDSASEETARKMAQHVSSGVTAVLDEAYDPPGDTPRLDVFHPSGPPRARTTVVWIHGGGWVSGSKDFIANYARILAAQGFTVVAVGYSLAPKARYPMPVRQVNAALGYLVKNAERLQIDPSRIVLAGDSAGAQMALQIATITLQPDYARLLGITPKLARNQLAGLLLYCGIYRMDAKDTDNHVLTTEFWAYSGSRTFIANARFATAWVIERVSADFPPTFISVGNADDLAPQSVALANALEKKGVRVDRLIFPADHASQLRHEFQFEMDRPEAQQALARSVAFLSGLRP